MNLGEAIRSPIVTAVEIGGYAIYRLAAAPFPVLVDEFSLSPISLNVPSDLCCCNPSIVAKDDGWLAIVRTHNWFSIEGKRKHKTDGKKLINRNWLVSLSDDLRVLDQTILTVDDSAIAQEDRERLLVDGISDCRLFRYRDTLYALGYGSNVRNRLSVMALCQVTDSQLVISSMIASPNNLNFEKNWMPLAFDGEICAVYRANPFTLVTLCGGSANVRYSRPLDEQLPEYSGSSQVIPFKDGMLCVVHRVIVIRWRRIYLHRFILFDKKWEITAMSREFFIEKKGLEFCAGLANKGSRYVISYGVDDMSARAVELTEDLVQRLLDRSWT